jgi:hypothetical protein
MALSSELREALAGQKRRPRLLSKQPLEQLPAPDDPDDRINPDDHGQVSSGELSPPEWLALPPIPPAWSFLCDRGHSAVSALTARAALASVACYLGTHPTPDALRQASKARSASALRQLIRESFGEVGLSAAYELGGLIPPKRHEPPNVTITIDSESGHRSGADKPPTRWASVETSDSLARSCLGYTSEARIMRWLDRPEPMSPPWRGYSPPPAGADDGSWVG